MAKSKTIRSVADLVPDARNANRGTERGASLLEHSLRQYGAGRSVLADKNGSLIAGNKTVEQAAQIGMNDVIVVPSDGKKLIVVQRTDLDLTKDKAARELAVIDNRVGQLDLDWDAERLLALMKGDDIDIRLLGFTEKDIEALNDKMLLQQDDYDKPVQHLHDKFLVPPFTVLDSTQSYWLERKRTWWKLGMEGTKGRSGNAYERKGNDFWGARMRTDQNHKTTTDFDPVMAEVAYRWFCPKNGAVLDPFSGGSVRGIIAAKCGYSYVGIDVRPDQIEENNVQAKRICNKGKRPTYHAGGSQHVIPTLKQTFDLIFSSPPYAGIEVHSDLEDDISNKDYADFLRVYRDIIAKAVAKLRDNRFAVFVVGEARDSRGFYKGFVPDTIRAFEDAGARFYNEAVLVTPVVNLAVRITKHFPNYRKLGKRHQNVLVFYKGDPKKIPDALGEFELPPLEEFENARTGDEHVDASVPAVQ